MLYVEMSLGFSREVFMFTLLRHVVITALVLFCTYHVALAADGYQEVDAKDVKAMMDTGGVLVVFPLSPIEFADQHISGSVNIPLAKLAENLPADKSQKLVFYCLGVKCTASWRAAKQAAALGYQNVFAFREGLPAWVEAGYPTEVIEKVPDYTITSISTDSLASMLLSSDTVLLNVCLTLDAEKFWIDTPARIHIPMDELQDRLAEIPRNKKIAIICLKGKRSPLVARYLMGKGFMHVYSVDGGLQKWVMEGRPVAKG
jgi:rhodanese-related sulfurtransferase